MTFWNLFFLMLIYIPLLVLWVFSLHDLSLRADMSGITRGLWAIAIVFLPVVGMIIYFVAGQDPATAIKAPESGGSAAQLTDDVISQIEKLGKLRDSGTITEDEFAAFKTKLLT